MAEQLFPEPTVGILIFNPRGELFLMKTHKWHGKYGVPGGHIELGESAVEAARDPRGNRARDSRSRIPVLAGMCLR